MKKEIEIPKGCKKIIIEIDDDGMIVCYSPDINNKVFMCDETGEMEELPKVGDFAIFWNHGFRYNAIVANFDNIHGERFVASNGDVYDKAVRFRSQEQYLKVRGIYGEDEP